MKKLLITAALMTSSLLAENFANLQITNSTVFINAQAHIAKEDPIYLRGGYLINQDKDNFGYVGIKTEGELLGDDDSSTTGCLFIDTVYTKDKIATPIGIGTSTYLNFKVPTFFRWEIEYAPKILSYDKADRFLKGSVEIGERFIEHAEAYIGYRNIAFNHLYNNAVYVGVGFVF